MAIGAARGVRREAVPWAVVACFAVLRVNDAIAAAWNGAIAVTAIVVGCIAIVALLPCYSVDIAVAAGFVRGAIGRAAIARNDVAVVAGFASIAHGVATAARLAIGAARGICREAVRGASIAGFAVLGVDDAIAAAGDRAVVAASVGVVAVTIVAGFTNREIGNAVAAGFVGIAVGSAAVSRGGVAVVANFGACHQSIATYDGAAGAASADTGGGQPVVVTGCAVCKTCARFGFARRRAARWHTY